MKRVGVNRTKRVGDNRMKHVDYVLNAVGFHGQVAARVAWEIKLGNHADAAVGAIRNQRLDIVLRVESPVDARQCRREVWVQLRFDAKATPVGGQQREASSEPRSKRSTGRSREGLPRTGAPSSQITKEVTPTWPLGPG